MNEPITRGGSDEPLSEGPVSTGDHPLNRAAAAIRRITGVIVGRPVGDDEMGEAADRLALIAGDLESNAGPPSPPLRSLGPRAHLQDFFPTSPMIGYANPIAPPVDVWAVEGQGGRREIRGRVTYGYPYEGPPTCVHGGIIAELFDELLGLVTHVAGTPGMTGTLTIRYRQPTPLLAPLDLEARWTGSEGRKVFAWGGIYHFGELTAEAEGIFIVPQPGRIQEVATTQRPPPATA
jgi:hypothetical protein